MLTFFVIFNVVIGELLQHENVIANLKISRFSQQSFRKICDFPCITHNQNFKK